MDTIVLIALGVVTAFVVSMVALPFAIGQSKGDVQIYNQQRSQVIKTAENYYTETNVSSVNNMGAFPQLKDASEGEHSLADKGDVTQENPNSGIAGGDTVFDNTKYDAKDFIQEHIEQEVFLSSDEGRVAGVGQQEVLKDEYRGIPEEWIL